MPEAKPRDTNHTVGIISIWYFNKKYILIARSKDEGILPIKTHILVLQKVLKVSNFDLYVFWFEMLTEMAKKIMFHGISGQKAK